MRSRLMMIHRVALLGATLLWLGGVTAQAQTFPLSNFVNANGTSNGGSFTLNEGGGISKIFSNFIVTSNVASLSGGVNVTFATNVNGDGPGVIFTGSFNNPTTTPVDYHFTFNVSPVGSNIVDVGLGANPASLGTGGQVLITENGIPSFGAPLSLTLVNNVITANPTSQMVTLPAPIRPGSTLTVEKDVSVTNAFFSTLSNSFSQSTAPPGVPEPGSLLMGCMSITLLGAGYGWRRLRAARLS